MKANELRIGNWAYNEIQEIPYQVDGNLISLYHSREKGVEGGWLKGKQLPDPVPLTEEWLKRFGFKEWENRMTFKRVMIYRKADGCYYYGKASMQTSLKHVHQLQNLYFALTGEELTLQSYE